MKGKKIVLWGMMGCGKTSVGSSLAAKLGLDFYDLDALIEKKCGQGISEIFEQFGEAKFRRIENEMLMEILQRKRFVLSVGGGCPMVKVNFERLKESTYSIFLDVDLEILLDRLSKSSERDKRPLLHSENWKEQFESLLKERESTYRKADLHLKAESSVDEIVDQIEQGLV